MRKYTGPGYVPGVPARDLSEDEWREAVKAGLIDEKGPSAQVWKKDKEVSDDAHRQHQGAA